MAFKLLRASHGSADHMNSENVCTCTVENSMTGGRKKIPAMFSTIPYYSSFLELLPEWVRTCMNPSAPFVHKFSVVNGVVVFHVLTFIVWIIIFAKDLMFDTKHPVGDKNKSQ